MASAPGFINKPFDLKFMDSLVSEPEWATQYSIHELVEKTGTQGVELLMWLATRGAVPGRVRKVHTQLPHPDLQHGGGIDGAGGGLTTLGARQRGKSWRSESRGTTCSAVP